MVQLLREAGFQPVRTVGSHTLWRKGSTSIPVPDGQKTISPGVVRKIRELIYGRNHSSKLILSKKSWPSPAVARAVARLAPEDRERYSEEWEADYRQISGRVQRWLWSLGLQWSAWRISERDVGRPAERYSHGRQQQ
jgi:predicted RNA binding protein YcfA (HicA-like mRNA interferase family)